MLASDAADEAGWDIRVVAYWLGRHSQGFEVGGFHIRHRQLKPVVIGLQGLCHHRCLVAFVSIRSRERHVKCLKLWTGQLPGQRHNQAGVDSPAEKATERHIAD